MITRVSRRLWIIAVVVVLLAVAITVFAARSSSAAPQYRTAVAEPGGVEVTLDATGAIQPVDRADLTFPVAGSVAAVPVTVGQKVGVGAVLAQLDTTALDAQVATAASQVATAQARLAADRSGQGGAAQGGRAGSVPSAGTPASAAALAGPAGSAVQAGSSGSAGPSAPPAAQPGAGPAGRGSGQVTATVDAAAEAVTRAVGVRSEHANAADAALAATRDDLDAATAACATDTSAATDTSGPAGPDSPAAEPPPARHAQVPHPDPAPGGTAACQQALQKVLAGQTEVARLQQRVSDDEAGLSQAVDALVTVAVQVVRDALDGPAPATGAGSPSGVTPADAAQPAAAPSGMASSGAAPSGAALLRAGPGETASSAVSPEQLAADRAAVDAADAQLAVARQNRDLATLTSPIDGTVGALDLAVGGRVSGGSGATQVVVIGSSSGYQVETSVSEVDVARIAVGDRVTVTPDGTDTPLTGTVAAIGLLPESAASTAAAGGAATYPVTIALPGVTGPYPAGQGASVAIHLADVDSALTVPTSAVHTNGAARTVDVLRGGVPQPVPVQVGAVGARRTEITSGLTAGAVVVIADPSRPLPTTGLTGLRGIGGPGGRPGG